MYPNFFESFVFGLEAAVAHHNRSHTTALGCSLNFAAFGQASYLPANKNSGIKNYRILMEEKKSPQQHELYRKRIKKNYQEISFSTRHTSGRLCQRWKRHSCGTRKVFRAVTGDENRYNAKCTENHCL